MNSPKKIAGGLGVLILLIVVLSAVMFRLSFSPPYVMFSSDGPLGYISSQWPWAADSFDGFWQDLNWVGSEQPSATPNVSMALFLLLGPVAFLKFYVPLTLLILGISAWFLLKRLGLSAIVCVLGGFAAAFNTHPFSFACWGLGSLVLTFASSFFAIGLLATRQRTTLHVILAGFCIGMGIAEGFDNGAIMSLYAAAWFLFLQFSDGARNATRFGKVIALVGVMAACAGLLAAQTLHTLVTTQIQGVSGTQQDTKTKEQQWDWATQWSLPKAETLRVIVPGLYGYRIDTPGGGAYWGTVGQQPGWEQHRQGLPRHSGAGEYAGVLVVLLALFAVACAIGKSKTLSDHERRIIWFWVAVGIVSLLLSYGRHAPFYKLFYSLPYFSTIRNPIKFMLPAQMALIILFAFGAQCLYRKYEQGTKQTALSAKAAFAGWWKNAANYERRFGQLLIALLAALVLGYLIYYSSAREVRNYLISSGFPEADAAAIHLFSLGELRWTILFAAFSGLLIVAALAGLFSGGRAKWLTVAVTVVLMADLYRANRPWVVYYNYKDKYELHSLLATLEEKPFERRVTAKLHPMGNYLADIFQQIFQVPSQSGLLNSLYNEWLQHQFQYYRIHSLDISQMPRVPELDQQFFSTFMPKNGAELPLATRMWELTGTRWILGEKRFADFLNQALDPQQKRFRVHAVFNFAPKEGRANPTSFDDIKAEIVPNGQFAIIEFTGALPRAIFFTSWQVDSNDSQSLLRLASGAFNPHEQVIVNTPIPAPITNNLAQGTNAVRVVSYQPREWQIEVENERAGILLLNDRFDDDWSVTVDGKQERLLRCNYLMRGVYLDPGKHQVVFNYSIPKRGLYISLAATAIGIIIACYLGLSSRKKAKTTK